MAILSSPSPTRPELAILKCLWRGGRQTARAIHADVNDEFSWSYSTLRTVLERMNDKDLVEKSADKGTNFYAAKIAKVELLAAMISDFSERVLELDGPASPALYAGSKLLNAHELQALEKSLSDNDSKA